VINSDGGFSGASKLCSERRRRLDSPDCGAGTHAFDVFNRLYAPEQKWTT
jgi:hypothetical protein